MISLIFNWNQPRRPAFPLVQDEATVFACPSFITS